MNISEFPATRLNPVLPPPSLRTDLQRFRRGATIKRGLCALLAACGSYAWGATATISATPSQTVKGWGVFPSYFRTDWGADYHIFNRPQIQDAIYDLGITFIRVDVQPRLYLSGTTLSNIVLRTTAVDDLVNQLQMARDHGVTTYIMSCWSPPAVWKEPEQTINGKSSTGQNEHLNATYNSAYIAYYTKVLQTLQSRGVGLPIGVSIQNEPDLAPGYDGCYYTDRKDQWKTLVKAMRASLDANGLSSVKVLGVEATNTDNDHQFLGGSGFPDFTSDPALKTAIGAYASHGYSQFWWTPLKNGMAAHPKDAFVTEWCVDNGRYGTDTMDVTIAVARHFSSNMVDLPYNYWCWWNAWAPVTTPGAATLVGGDQIPTFNKRYYFFQKVWKTVRPGWVVKRLTCDDTAFKTSNSSDTPYPPPPGVPSSGDTFVDLVAFENASSNATSSAVILVNTATTTKTMIVNGLKGNTQQAFQTTSTADMTPIASGSISGGSTTLSLPARSVTFLATQTVQTFETESLAVAGSSGENSQILSATQLSGGGGTMQYSNGVNDYVTYTVPNVAAGTYNVKVGVKKYTSRGIVQLSAGPSGGTLTNVGTPQDQYANGEVYTEVDLGPWVAGSTGNKSFKFTITGKNTSSTGHTMAFDYIRLTRQ